LERGIFIRLKYFDATLASTTQKTAFYLFRAVYVTLGIFGISKSVFDVIWGLRNHFMDGFVKLQVEDCEDNDQKITVSADKF
jgi:hypothetical protein